MRTNSSRWRGDGLIQLMLDGHAARGPIDVERRARPHQHDAPRADGHDTTTPCASSADRRRSSTDMAPMLREIGVAGEKIRVDEW